MSNSNDFIDYVIEQMHDLGVVNARRMFGGHGLFFDGLMFALVANDCLYLKADAESIPEFQTRELSAFSYYKKGKEFNLSYFQCPAECLEDDNEMTVWARTAYDVALRNAKKTAPPRL